MLSPKQYAALLDTSMTELQQKMQSHVASWGIDRFARWDLHQNTGELIFSNPTGIAAVCKAQIIGTLGLVSNTWLWAWANPSILDGLKREALTVRQFGEENRIKQLITPQWKAQEEDGWAMAALAVKLCKSEGAYRAPDDMGFTFVSFSSITLKHINA